MNLYEEIQSAAQRMQDYFELWEQHKNEVAEGNWVRGKHFDAVVEFTVQNRMDRYALADYLLQLIRLEKALPEEEKTLESPETLERMAQEEKEASRNFLIKIIKDIARGRSQ